MADIIDKIRKLANLARGTTGHEAETAWAHAQRIAAEHGIAMADIETPETKEDITKEIGVVFKGNTSTWRWRLAANIARVNDCVCVRSRVTGGYFLTFIGRPSDIAIVKELYAMIEPQIVGLSAGLGFGKSFSDSFRNGMVQKIADRLYQAKTEALRTALTSTSMIIISRLDDAKKAAGATKTVKPRTALMGFDHGRAAGDRVRLNKELDEG